LLDKDDRQIPVTQIAVAPAQRIFARLQRLLANDLAARDIHLTTSVEPETLEIAADTELLDQAPHQSGPERDRGITRRDGGRIFLSAHRDPDAWRSWSRTTVQALRWNQREKIFVPFFTPKRKAAASD
jgi:hypothetical protein